MTIPALGRSAGMETSLKSDALLSILAVGGVAGVALATGVVGGSGGLGRPDEADASALEPFSHATSFWNTRATIAGRTNAYPYAVTTDVAFMSLPTGAGGGRKPSAPPCRRTATPSAPSETGTNTQEIGIDEPDIAKLSGYNALPRSGQASFSAYDVSGSEAVLLDELELSLAGGSGPIDVFEGSNPGAQLLIAGDSAS